MRSCIAILVLVLICGPLNISAWTYPVNWNSFPEISQPDLGQVFKRSDDYRLKRNPQKEDLPTEETEFARKKLVLEIPALADGGVYLSEDPNLGDVLHHVEMKRNLEGFRLKKSTIGGKLSGFPEDFRLKRGIGTWKAEPFRPVGDCILIVTPFGYTCGKAKGN